MRYSDDLEAFLVNFENITLAVEQLCDQNQTGRGPGQPILADQQRGWTG